MPPIPRSISHLLIALLILRPVEGLSETGVDNRQRNPFSVLPSGEVEENNEIASESLPAQRPPGLKGVRIAETTIIGIVSSQQLALAVLRTADQSTYIVRVGSQLFDGRILLITDRGIVFQQDPHSAPVLKPLRGNRTE